MCYVYLWNSHLNCHRHIMYFKLSLGYNYSQNHEIGLSDFYHRASELYRECGRPQPASDALAKGASALEEKSPEEAIKMYDEACSVLEEDGKEQMAFDLYHAAAALYIKMVKKTNRKCFEYTLLNLTAWNHAGALFLRLGSAADKCNAINSQCKAYLSAIIIYLYTHDFYRLTGFKPSSIATRIDGQRSYCLLMRKVILKKSNALLNQVPSITLTM
ncbi:hypothetical protein ACJX0J_036741, partial [Zea mays]